MTSFTQSRRHPGIDAEDIPVRRRFRRNVSISVVGSGISLAARLAQTALLAKALKIDDYGRLLLVLNFFVFLDSFFGLRVSDAMFRFFPLFKERRDERALDGLLLLSLGVCLASALLIYGGVLILSSVFADRFYPNLALTPLFRIYGFTILFSSFSGIYEPVLRLHNHFSSIVAPQVLGSLLTLALLCIYFAGASASIHSANRNYNLEVIVAAFAAGALIQSMLPLIKALRVLRPFLSLKTIRESLRELAPYRRPIVSCLMNSNLSGYLKFAISPGDVFLLGLFSTPTQLALFGLAKQLTAPLAFLQTNIQTAVTPEISALVARGRFEQVRRLVTHYLTRSLILGAILLAGVVALGRFLILNFLRPEYASALPIFYLLAVAGWLMLAFLVFRPLALNLEILQWHNLALLISSSVVICLIIADSLNAMSMACIQLAEVLLLRSLLGVFISRRLSRLGSDKPDHARTSFLSENQ
jgi:O-antigen/teichoic acid export membrane protein